MLKNKKFTIGRSVIVEQNSKTVEFQAHPRFFGIGQDIQPKKDLSRFVKWPAYIKIQRQRRIFFQKLKVPFSISQFTRVLDKNMSKQVFQLLSKYKIEGKINKEIDSTENKKNQKSLFLKHGIESVSSLVEKKKALFVLIAHDVNPIECVVWLPSLCLEMNIPFCIIKNKSKLGKLVNRKKTSCISMSFISGKHKEEIKKIINCFRSNFNNRYEDAKKRWGK
mmetsp:Transcript_26714/g.63121  ORF Transcript_26714/g.63121 Transcript_26714/m.63121 type:complete len:222 (+) Transcript_26714:1030-1695(+)